MRHSLGTLLCVVALAFASLEATAGDLPLLGTRFHPLPPGKGKSQVEAACSRCHSADMIVQQQLTEKQWTATVEKMVRWGAPLREADRQVVLTYLSSHFGPGNTKFRPIATQPSR